MIESDITPSGKASNDAAHVEESGRANLAKNEQSELDEYLDEAAAEEEEDDELEEESEVEAAAEANRK